MVYRSLFLWGNFPPAPFKSTVLYQGQHQANTIAYNDKASHRKGIFNLYFLQKQKGDERNRTKNKGEKKNNTGRTDAGIKGNGSI